MNNMTYITITIQGKAKNKGRQKKNPGSRKRGGEGEVIN
jgi:hypothetical protein